MRGHARRDPRLREQYWRASVLQHEGQALFRIRGVQWYVRASGFKNAKEADNHLGAALHANGHRHVRSHAQRLQMMRQLIGASVELSIGQLLIVEHDGNVVRRALDLLSEQLVDELVL